MARSARRRRLPDSRPARTTGAAALALPSGLVWVSDTLPGIRRIRQDNGFAYRHPGGRAVRDAATLDRIRRLAIPPAYEDVWICPDPNGHLQATGRDARGRKQYRYHAEWQRERGATKFDALRDFGSVLPRLRARVERDLAAAGSEPPARAHVLAAVVRLLDTTFLRIGNEEYARGNGSYGLTTLRCRHVTVQSRALRLRFKGKSGVHHEAHVDDARVAAVVRRCRQLPGQELFQYCEGDGGVHRVTSADVNDWLADTAGRRITAKDFRTWHGSVMALEFMRRAPDAAATRSGVVAVVAEVARRLGNTAAVCRKSYIHPAVLAGDAAPEATPAGPRGLSAAERRLMAVLARPAP